jgi:hypothetical protein
MLSSTLKLYVNFSDELTTTKITNMMAVGRGTLLPTKCDSSTRTSQLDRLPSYRKITGIILALIPMSDFTRTWTICLRN